MWNKPMVKIGGNNDSVNIIASTQVACDHIGCC